MFYVVGIVGEIEVLSFRLFCGCFVEVGFFEWGLELRCYILLGWVGFVYIFV